MIFLNPSTSSGFSPHSPWNSPLLESSSHRSPHSVCALSPIRLIYLSIETRKVSRKWRVSIPNEQSFDKAKPAAKKREGPNHLPHSSTPTIIFMFVGFVDGILASNCFRYCKVLTRDDIQLPQYPEIRRLVGSNASLRRVSVC